MPATAPDGHDFVDAPAIRSALAGFFLSGVLSAFVGAILPAWGYHLKEEYLTAGTYFLFVSLGVIISTEVARRVVPRRGVTFTLAFSAALACGALLFLSAFPPPASSWWRMAGTFMVGLAAGGLNTALLHAVVPFFRRDSAATLNLAGVCFNAGCVAVAWAVSGAFYVYTVGSMLVLISVLPGMLAGVFARTRWTRVAAAAEPSFRDAIQDFKSAGAVLLALVLFFQFGNEWATAGWLPIFLIQRIGMSPTASLLYLALYWLAILAARGVASYLLRTVRHRILLLSSALTTLFGCVILLFTNNQFGVLTGVLFLGTGFGPVYPLIAAKIGDRYRYFRPGFFNGIFSFALTGGMLAPWSLGLFAEKWGIGVVMGLPLAGTAMVVVLLLLVWLEAKLHG